MYIQEKHVSCSKLLQKNKLEQVVADLAKKCAFRDKSMKLGTWFLDTLRSILKMEPPPI